MVDVAEKVADLLVKKGFSIAIVNARFVKPLDKEVIINLGKKVKILVSLEENTIFGGFGSGILEVLSEEGVFVETMLIGAPDRFIEQASRNEQLTSADLNPEQIFSRILKKISSLNLT